MINLGGEGEQGVVDKSSDTGKYEPLNHLSIYYPYVIPDLSISYPVDNGYLSTSYPHFGDNLCKSRKMDTYEQSK